MNLGVAVQIEYRTVDRSVIKIDVFRRNFHLFRPAHHLLQSPFAGTELRRRRNYINEHQQKDHIHRENGFCQIPVREKFRKLRFRSVQTEHEHTENKHRRRQGNQRLRNQIRQEFILLRDQRREQHQRNARNQRKHQQLHRQETEEIQDHPFRLLHPEVDRLTGQEQRHQNRAERNDRKDIIMAAGAGD